MDKDILLQAKGLGKHFAGVMAVNNIDLEIKTGQIHAIVGENGAGKSTLMKILAGVHQADGGEIILKDKPVVFNNPHDAQQQGVVLIHQELHLIPFFNTIENLFLGFEYFHGIFEVLDFGKMSQNARSIIDSLGLDFDLKKPVKNLSTSQRQVVAIAKALLQNVLLLIMDEPTARLCSKEISVLFNIIKKLKESGVTIIYISHRLEEVLEISDEITILRDGQKIKTLNTNEANIGSLIQMMVGREIKEKYPKVKVALGNIEIAVKNMSRGHLVRDVNFEVRSGEILGIFGLVGSGRTELLRLLFGLDKKNTGQFIINHNEVQINSPKDAIRMGLALVPEDRQGQGLIMGMKVRENSTLVHLSKFCRFGFVNLNHESRSVNSMIEKLNIKTYSQEQKVKSLSGGNQQKVVLSKWLIEKPVILLLDEPTRGIDVASKAEIFRLVSEIVKNGAAVIFVSSELPEIMGISDRVLIMYEGRQMIILETSKTSSEKILFYATGGENR